MYVLDKSKQPENGNESNNLNLSQSITHRRSARMRGRGFGRRPVAEEIDVPTILKTDCGNESNDSNISQSSTQSQKPPQRRYRTWFSQNRGGSGRHRRRSVTKKTHNSTVLKTEDSVRESTKSESEPQGKTLEQIIKRNYSRIGPSEEDFVTNQNTEVITTQISSCTGLRTSNEESQRKYTILEPDKREDSKTISFEENVTLQDPPNTNIDLYEEKTKTTTLPKKYVSLKMAIDFYQQKYIIPLNDDKMSIYEEQFVLPKSVQNNQICDKCLNYLSVGPVTTTNQQIICGRKSCYDVHINYNKSLYNRIAEKYFFNCINQFNGCQAVLPFTEEMAQHEIVCCYAKKHTCMKCKFQGNGCQMIQHYKTSHSNVVAQHGVFKLEFKATILNRNLVFPIDNDMILINIKIYNNKLNIYYEHLNVSNKLRYSLIIFQPGSNFEYVSTLTDFKSETIDLLEMKKFFSSQIVFGAVRLHIQNPFQKLPILKFPDNSYTKHLKNILDLLLRPDISCCNCKRYIKDKKAVAFCPQTHVSCTDCLGTYCESCETDCLWLDIKTVFTGYKIPCDWKLCTKQIDCMDFFVHKQVCSKREYTCPISGCSFVGNKEDLATHWHSPIPLKFGKYLTLITQTNEQCFWIIDNLHELLHIKIDKSSKNYEFIVNEKFAIFPNNYKLELLHKPKNSKRFEKIGDLTQKGNIKTYSHNLQLRDVIKFIVKINENLVIEDIPQDEIITNKLPEVLLKNLISLLFRIDPKCSNCSNLMHDRAELYVCTQGHITCYHCLIICIRCTTDNVKFLRLNDLLLDLKLSCDWPGCKKITSCWNFLFHKQICPKRQYECSNLMTHNKCSGITKDDLQKHWHSEHELTVGTHLEFKTQSLNKRLYWLTTYVNELLIVTVSFNDLKWPLEVCEKNAIFPNNYKLELYDYNTIKKRYEIVTELKQAGNSKICTKNLKVNTNYRLTIKVIH